MEEKKCSKCLNVKNTDNFYRSGGSRQGWAAECKACYKLRKRKPKPKIEKPFVKEEDLLELDKTYDGLKIKCKMCDEIKPSYHYHFIRSKFHRACNKCNPNFRYKIPQIFGKINLEELKIREYQHLKVKSLNDEDQKLKNLNDADRILKLISSRRGFLELEELLDMMNISLNISEKIVDSDNTHNQFVKMYNNILLFYRTQKTNE